MRDNIYFHKHFIIAKRVDWKNTTNTTPIIFHYSWTKGKLTNIFAGME